MKKFICVVICLFIGYSIFWSGFSVKGLKANNVNSMSLQNSIENKIIRFHVIANSDKAEDQALKLKVRDKVLEYIAPKLKTSKSIEESRQILMQNDTNIQKIADKVIKDNGYSYKSVTMLSKEDFPVKTYGNITLPQGEYEAYRIIIGNGSGQNWWCVMFPPLCFIDITKGEVSYKETEKAMKEVLSQNEYEEVDNTNSLSKDGKEEKNTNKDLGKANTENAGKDTTEKLEIRFKILDELKKLFS
ncbi:stage II sporulation protein R [Candidatus Clostridium radicumherbarum]|uniref:Stage II sporulation protein R n=1 Tax=Candidatus Clostridium radicumherbarum TaxID=3381662 RepID=A0ABW8TRA6_9CLOT